MRYPILALLILAVSCSDTVEPQPRLTDLAAARLRWNAQDLHTYAFTIQRSCFCVNTNRLYVLVLSDTVAGVIDLDTGQPADRQLGLTVNELFSLIQGAIDRPAQLIRAEYEATKGFPTEIDYDGSLQIADDEISFRVSDVHPITPPS